MVSFAPGRFSSPIEFTPRLPLSPTRYKSNAGMVPSGPVVWNAANPSGGISTVVAQPLFLAI